MSVSRKYSPIPSVLSLPPASIPSGPLGRHSTELSSLHCTATPHQLSGLHMVMCTFSGLLSQFVLPSPSPAVSASLFSVSVSLSCPANRCIRNICRLHKCALIYGICFSLSDLTSLCVTGSRFIHLSSTGSNSFLFIKVLLELDVGKDAFNISFVFLNYLLLLD